MGDYIEREAAIDAIMKVYVRTAGYKARERVFEADEGIRGRKRYIHDGDPGVRAWNSGTEGNG